MKHNEWGQITDAAIFPCESCIRVAISSKIFCSAWGKLFVNSHAKIMIESYLKTKMTELNIDVNTERLNALLVDHMRHVHMWISS